MWWKNVICLGDSNNKLFSRSTAVSGMSYFLSSVHCAHCSVPEWLWAKLPSAVWFPSLQLWQSHLVSVFPSYFVSDHCAGKYRYSTLSSGLICQTKLHRLLTWSKFDSVEEICSKMYNRGTVTLTLTLYSYTTLSGVIQIIHIWKVSLFLHRHIWILLTKTFSNWWFLLNKLKASLFGMWISC